MTEFEQVLQECLHDLERGASSMDGCLSRHPEYARELEPILLASESLGQAGQARISDSFKARVRARLIREMHAHPRAPQRKPVAARPGFVLARLAVGLAAILMALLVTGTAYAQNTMPGEALYGWKLASEDAWRVVSSDPVETDLVIAERRVSELVAVRDDPTLRARTLEAYFETVNRLKSQTGTGDETRITQTLDSQMEKLKKLGILLSQVDPATLPSDEPVPPTPTPSIIPSTVTVTSMPTLQTPSVEPTASPQIIPTSQVPPRVDPTAEKPPKIIPTVEIPPELFPTFEVPPPIR
ncbi:MAG TPA: hypothetical protein VFQ13_10895 [Anaerolineales bacterium]|nr:hypothetical protein [Anaerolineales bacterium]